jgi:curli production assembly/transport component CsgG
MRKTLIALSLLSVINGCAVIQTSGLSETDPEVTTQMKNVKKEFDTIPGPAVGKPVSVAVYSFQDKTGQRRPQANVASLSTAVTQGAETFLIKALSDVSGGKWFEVVERVGIDNLTKERLIIRQMREAYEGNNAKPLMPMQFAGMIIEGGIVGYDTSTTSGGAGMRVFGIGKQTQWSTDTVTISLRAVSVNTGKVLISVTVQKTILSTGDSVTALKFFDQATKAFEAEAGLTINEPGTYAVKAATEMAVVEMIKEGQRKGVWDFKTETPVVLSAPIVEKKAPVISSEIKKAVEEKKDVVVQPQPISETKPEEVLIPRVAPGAAAEVKVEEKKVESKPNESKMAQVTARPLFGERKLKEGSYLYANEDEASTKKWWFPKGSIVSVRQPGTEGWWRVMITDGSERGGWIRSSQLE